MASKIVHARLPLLPHLAVPFTSLSCGKPQDHGAISLPPSLPHQSSWKPKDAKDVPGQAGVLCECPDSKEYMLASMLACLERLMHAAGSPGRDRRPNVWCLPQASCKPCLFLLAGYSECLR